MLDENIPPSDIGTALRNLMAVLAGKDYHAGRDAVAKVTQAKAEEYFSEIRRRMDGKEFPDFSDMKKHWDAVVSVYYVAIRDAAVRPNPEAGSRLFITDTGLVGTCRGVRDDDKVVLLLGCKAPAVLRKAPVGYSFVGVALVAGLMEGQEWEEDLEFDSLETYLLCK